MTQTNDLEVRSIKKNIGDFTLDADFTVRAGERAALIGKSGSGKTSLLRILAGLEPADSGQVILGGQDLTDLPPQKRNVGMIFQDFALFPSLNVLENVAFGLTVRNVGTRSEREEKALSWLEKVGLRSRAADSVTVLSGGEAQRVAFARALIVEPKLLLLDEPFSSLDVENRAALRRELVELHQICPVPTLLVSHDPQDQEEVANVRLKLEVSSDSAMRIVRRSS